MPVEAGVDRTAPAVAAPSRNGRGLPAPKPVGGKQAGAVRTRVRPVQALPSQQAPAPVVRDTDGAPAALKAKGLARPATVPALSYSGPSDDGGIETSGVTDKTITGAPSRNAPCPCGSGKKFKLCHGRPGAV